MNEELRRAVIEDAIKNYGKSGAGMRWSDESIKLYMQLPGGKHITKKHTQVEQGSIFCERAAHYNIYAFCCQDISRTSRHREQMRTFS